MLPADVITMAERHRRPGGRSAAGPSVVAFRTCVDEPPSVSECAFAQIRQDPGQCP